MKGYPLIIAALVLTACSGGLPGRDSAELPDAVRSGEETPFPATIPGVVESPPVEDSAGLTSENFSLGTRINARITPEQLTFINQNFQYVMTPILLESVRNAVHGPELILYRSIQGTWEGFDQFDWDVIDSRENMFLHQDGERILTRWNSWLMNPGDLVSAEAPDALDHWINYYAVTAAAQVHQYGYDGLFIDSASHWLNPWAVFDRMPDDYDVEDWYQDRVDGLAFIKSYLGDKSVVFNGLHNEHGAEDSLANTDGGMWETFAFHPQTGKYQGEDQWRAAIELTAVHPDKWIVLVVKEQPDLGEDSQKRLFAVTSYLLVSRPNVVFTMTDLAHTETDSLEYYPEYTLDLGSAQGDYTVTEEGIYLRQFENGLVLVNPSEDHSLSYILDGAYQRIIPVGGGVVAEDGSWDGSLTYEPVSGEIEIPSLGAEILVRY